MSCPVYTEVNTAEWVYQEPRKNLKNGLNVYLHESASCPHNPRIQLERSRCPFGIQDGMEETSRKNLELSVDSPTLRAWGEKLDNQNIDWITENCPTLFKKVMTRETVETLYRPLITVSNKPSSSYNPLMRIKISSRASDTKVMIVVQEGTATEPLKWVPGDLSQVTKHCEVIPIVEAVGLWFVSKGCGMTFVAQALLVFPSTKVREFDFQLGGVAAERCENLEANDPILEPDLSTFQGGAESSPSSSVVDASGGGEMESEE